MTQNEKRIRDDLYQLVVGHLKNTSQREFAIEINTKLVGLHVEFLEIEAKPLYGNEIGKICHGELVLVEVAPETSEDPNNLDILFISHDKIQRYIAGKRRPKAKTLNAFALFFGYYGLEGFSKGDKGKLQSKLADNTLQRSGEKFDSKESRQWFPPRHLAGSYSIDPSQVIARQSDLENLHQLISDSGVSLVHGIGGIGKTTLLRYYLASSFAQQYAHICWIKVNGSWAESLTAESTLLGNLRISFPDDWTTETKYNHTINVLRNIDKKAILIIDNARLEMFNYTSSLPGGQWKVVIVSREEFMGLPKLELGHLGIGGSQSLFLHFYGKEFRDETLMRLFELMDYHPLAIELVAKTLRYHPNLGISKIIERFESRKANFSDWQIGVYTNYTEKEAKAMWHLRQIISLAGHTKQRKQMLMYFSLLPSLNWHKEYILMILNHVAEFPEKVVNDLHKLSLRGFVNLVDDEHYAMHKMIAEVIFYSVKPNFDKCKPFADYMLSLVGSKINSHELLLLTIAILENLVAFLDFPKAILLKFFEKLFKLYGNDDYFINLAKSNEYLERAVGFIREGVEIPRIPKAQILSAFLKKLFAEQKISEYQKLALEWYPFFLGEETELEFMELGLYQARTMAKYGDLTIFNQALQLHKPLLQLEPSIEDLASFSNPELEREAIICEAVGDVLCSVGNLEGLAWLKKSLFIMENLRGFSVRKLSAIMEMIAITLLNGMDYTSAEEYFRKAIGLIIQKSSENDVRLIHNYEDLAKTLYKLDRVSESLEILQRAITIDHMFDWWRDTDPYRLFFYISRRAERVDEAIQFLEKTLENFNQKSESRGLRQAYRALAYCYASKGNQDYAQKSFKCIFPSPILEYDIPDSLKEPPSFSEMMLGFDTLDDNVVQHLKAMYEKGRSDIQFVKSHLYPCLHALACNDAFNAMHHYVELANAPDSSNKKVVEFLILYCGGGAYYLAGQNEEALHFLDRAEQLFDSRDMNNWFSQNISAMKMNLYSPKG